MYEVKPREESGMNMLKWVESQLKEIDVASIVGPEHDPQDGEEVVGVIEDLELRRLFALRKHVIDEYHKLRRVAEIGLHQEMEKLMESFLKNLGESLKGEQISGEETGDKHDPLICEGCQAACQLRALSGKCEVLNALFWGSLRAQVAESAGAKLYESGGIGICKDWQIVIMTPSKSKASVSIMGLGLPFSFGDLEETLGGK